MNAWKKKLAIHPNFIAVLVRKEWAELYRNTMLLGTVFFMPLLFAAIPLIMLWSMGADMGDVVGDGMGAFNEAVQGTCSGLSSGDCTLAIFLAQFNLMFMFIPIILPSTILPYAVVGEKTQRSLEPLLATPISSVDLLLAKAFSAIIPASMATWLSFGLYLSIAWVLAPNKAIVHTLFQWHWLFAVVIVGPLLALFTANLTLMVSSRTTEPRVAQQVAGLVVLPLVLLLIGQMSGMLLLTPLLIFLLGVSVAILDIIFAYLAVQIFDRETILTRWT